MAAELASRKAQRDKNAEKSRMKGKNRISKRYRKKQQNVVDDKKLRAKMLKEDEAKEGGTRGAAGGVGGRVGGDGPEGGGAMPAQTAGAGSDAPNAPDGTSSRAPKVLQMKTKSVDDP